MKKENLYVFIAVNYNNSNFTREYIKSVNEIEISEGESIRIIIVDNNSEEKDRNELECICKGVGNVKLIKSNINLGYFKGLNLGIKEAQKYTDRNLIIGNNDLTFDKKFIKCLKDIKYSNDIMVIAPNIITKDGRQQNPHALKKSTKSEILKNDIYYSNYYLACLLRIINKKIKAIKKQDISYTNNYGEMIIQRGIGACYILTENFTEKFRELDDRVFMWGEEALISHQIHSENGKMLYNPTIIINHHESATVTKIPSKKRYHMVKNSYKIYREYL